MDDERIDLGSADHDPELPARPGRGRLVCRGPDRSARTDPADRLVDTAPGRPLLPEADRQERRRHRVRERARGDPRRQHRPGRPAPGGRPRIDIRQGDRVLGCCETVKRDGGPLTITVEATDDNFGVLGVDLEGGCGVGIGIFSKSYNGNLADTGAPAPGIDIPWDPWAAGVEPCCYVIYVRISTARSSATPTRVDTPTRTGTRSRSPDRTMCLPGGCARRAGTIPSPTRYRSCFVESRWSAWDGSAI